MAVQENDKFILGDGLFSIGDIDVAITRGGGVFEVVKEYRAIEHDGQRSEFVKGMINLDKATPKLQMNTLSILEGADFTKMYANTRAVKSGEATTVTGDFKILDSDYSAVKWKGFLNDGRAAEIIITDAINLENINWALVDKGEVIHALNYVGTPVRGSKQQNWSIKFGTAEVKEIKK